jgi:putative ATPase
MKFCDELKPESFNDFVGQEHILHENSLLRRLIDENSFESVILVGPTGTGKTTLAELIGKSLTIPFYRLHAASSGSAEIKKIIETTKSYGKPSLIFIDEIHRFTKVQQDLLLDVLDGKYGKLIGASTENPYYNLTPALRSRSFFFKMKKLDEKDFRKLFDKIKPFICEKFDVSTIKINDNDFLYLVNISDGDARKFLNYLEIIVKFSQRKNDILILDFSILDDNYLLNISYSKDEHFDLLSALIKSIRGSSPDASLVWMVKLLKSGVSPFEILRRLLILASEDIGNAYPGALVFAKSAYDAFEKVGMPEGEIILSHLVTYLACCPKSNRSYIALKRVKKYLETDNPIPPSNIEHNNKSYKYPFDYGEFVKQNYGTFDECFYLPSEVGFEKKFLERLNRLWGGYE